MRILVSISLFALIALSGCKDDQFDLTENPLDGKIGGDPWNFASGGAGLDNFTTNISAILVANEIADPCAIVNTIRPHLTMTFPPRRGNYTLSVDNVQVIFNLEGGAVKYTAPGGFLEIVAIDGREIIGFLSADFDDDNTVEGSFLLEVCN